MNAEQIFKVKLPKWFSIGLQVIDKTDFYGACQINNIQKVYREKSFFRVQFLSQKRGIVNYIFYSVAGIREQWVPLKSITTLQSHR